MVCFLPGKEQLYITVQSLMIGFGINADLGFWSYMKRMEFSLLFYRELRLPFWVLHMISKSVQSGYPQALCDLGYCHIFWRAFKWRKCIRKKGNVVRVFNWWGSWWFFFSFVLLLQLSFLMLFLLCFLMSWKQLIWDSQSNLWLWYASLLSLLAHLSWMKMI